LSFDLLLKATRGVRRKARLERVAVCQLAVAIRVGWAGRSASRLARVFCPCPLRAGEASAIACHPASRRARPISRKRVPRARGGQTQAGAGFGFRFPSPFLGQRVSRLVSNAVSSETSLIDPRLGFVPIQQLPSRRPRRHLLGYVGSISTTFCAPTSSGSRSENPAEVPFAFSSTNSRSKVRRWYLSVVFVRSLRNSAMFALWTPSPLHGMHQDTTVQRLRAPFVGACLFKTGHRVGWRRVATVRASLSVLNKDGGR
jgi:hypothetical protein